jgi:hypothetical protein
MSSVSQILARGLVKFDPFAFQDILISVLYRLLHRFPPSDPGPEASELDRLSSLGLLAFMSTMLFQPGRKLRLPYELLATKLRHELLAETISSASLDESFLFWILYVGAISVFRDDDMDWLTPRVKSTASSLGIKDWASAREQLCRYPWIHVFHDGPARELWNHIATI